MKTKNLDESYIYYSGISSDEEEAEDLLEFNPWANETSPSYDQENEIDNPAVYVAFAENAPWSKEKDLHVGPLDDHQQQLFQDLIQNNHDICAASQTDIGRTNLIQHTIYTGDAAPIYQRAYRCNHKNQAFLTNEIAKMEKQGLITKSKSPWASPVVIVNKKGCEKRLCVDYRKLNALTRKDAYPIPRIDDLLESFRMASWFMTLDLASGYWQVMMADSDKEKTAFNTPFGLYQFNVMPFGLCNAPRTFQRLMNHVLQDFLEKFVAVYLDDIIIYSRTFEQHIDHVGQVFQALREAHLKIKLKKCYFAMPNISFLGHIVGREGLQPDPAKV
jgi:hypothetical protein